MTAAPDQPSFVVRAIATGLFTGYAPIAPGTAGSLLALAFFLIPGFDQPVVLGSSALLIFALGVFTSGQLSREGDRDPSVVVIDEVAGMWIAMLFLPATLPVVGASFLLFRIFDIIKPFPARNLERLPGGWGIMMDDVAAAIYANIAIQIFLLI